VHIQSIPRPFATALIAAAALAISVNTATAQPHTGDRLGNVHFPVSCNPAVQPKFDRAVALLHNFFWPETVKAFTAITQEDPNCAMAYWGLAMSERPNPLVPPFDPAVLKRGGEDIQKGKALNPQDPRERDYLDALENVYRDYDKIDQRTRSRAYAEAMGRLHERWPDDSEAAIFYALALNEAADLSDTTYTNQLKAAAILNAEAKKQPDHPGIAHYLIHSYDFAPLAAQCLPVARRYADLAPAAPHALHMPSHIYSMLGLWEDSIAANLAAEAALRDYLAKTPPGKLDRRVTHLWDFRVFAYLQMAQDREAKRVLDSLRELPTTGVFYLTSDMGFAAIMARYALDRGRWDEAARLEIPASNYPAARAISHFARGLGAARSGDPAAARSEVAQLDKIIAELTASGELYWANQVDIQRREVAAWIDLAEGKRDVAIAAMRAAADRDDASEKNVAMENKLLPGRVLLGELYLAVGMNQEALDAFEASLRLQPNRFRSLLGAAQAARAMGSTEVAKRYYRALVGLTVNADTERPELGEAKSYLAPG
jgi:hypothetical protein